MLRRRQPPDEPPPKPEWQRRFDDASALILSREQPDWVRRRLDELQQALVDADTVAERLAAAVRRIDPEAAASDLKAALRQREHVRTQEAVDDIDRRVATLRERYEAVNEMINRREKIERQMLNTAADVELLAVQALRSETMDIDHASPLDEHLERLDDDLRALEHARREVEEL